MSGESDGMSLFLAFLRFVVKSLSLTGFIQVFKQYFLFGERYMSLLHWAFFVAILFECLCFHSNHVCAIYTPIIFWHAYNSFFISLAIIYCLFNLFTHVHGVWWRVGAGEVPVARQQPPLHPLLTHYMYILYIHAGALPALYVLFLHGGIIEQFHSPPVDGSPHWHGRAWRPQQGYVAWRNRLPISHRRLPLFLSLTFL